MCKEGQAFEGRQDSNARFRVLLISPALAARGCQAGHDTRDAKQKRQYWALETATKFVVKYDTCHSIEGSKPLKRVLGPLVK